jgi:hypothetical protein
MLKIDGYDDAVIGNTTQAGSNVGLAYSYTKIIEITMRSMDIDLDGAVEWVELNIVGSYNGEETPFIVYEQSLNEIEEMLGEDVNEAIV